MKVMSSNGEKVQLGVIRKREGKMTSWVIGFRHMEEPRMTEVLLLGDRVGDGTPNWDFDRVKKKAVLG